MKTLKVLTVVLLATLCFTSAEAQHRYRHHRVMRHHRMMRHHRHM